MRALAILLVAGLCGCASLLDQPVYQPGPVGPDGVAGPPTPVLDPDGSSRTVGEHAADAIEEQAASVGATLGGLLGGPMAPLAGVAALLLGSGAATTLRRRHPGKPPAAEGVEGQQT